MGFKYFVYTCLYWLLDRQLGGAGMPGSAGERTGAAPQTPLRHAAGGTPAASELLCTVMRYRGVVQGCLSEAEHAAEGKLRAAQVRLQQVGERGAAAAAARAPRRARVHLPLRHGPGAQQVRACAASSSLLPLPQRSGTGRDLPCSQRRTASAWQASCPIMTLVQRNCRCPASVPISASPEGSAVF